MTMQPLMISTVHRPPSRFEDPSHNLAFASPSPTPPRSPSSPRLLGNAGPKVGSASAPRTEDSQPRARRSLLSSPFLSSRWRLGTGTTSLLRREHPTAAAAALFDSTSSPSLPPGSPGCSQASSKKRAAATSR
ncbi:hypothetical protein DFH09DRAFT_1331623 [Mycena vulgaris]|nr:hypothetical protein DFH09DRAFT_1331623 [Mycena vulgaris]